MYMYITSVFIYTEYKHYITYFKAETQANSDAIACIITVY